MKAAVISAVCGLTIWSLAACSGPLEAAPPAPKVASARSGVEDIPGAVLIALEGTEQTADQREQDRRKAYDDQRVQLEPMAKGLSDAVRAGKVDLDGYLSSSQKYVIGSETKIDPSVVTAVNQTYGPGIQSAIASAVNVAGVGGLLQQTQVATAPGNPPGGGGGAAPNGGCCTAQHFQPPWSGLYEEGDFGARAIRPGPTTQLEARVRSAIAAAPHRLEQSGLLITVPSTAGRVSAAATLDTSWVIGLSGLGYAHVWLGLDMSVSKPDGTVVCRAPHLEQDNQWTWAGGFLTLSDHRPGPTIVRGCSFDRAPGDPTEYSVNVAASSDGTFIGFSGGYGDYYVNLGVVDVVACD